MSTQFEEAPRARSALIPLPAGPYRPPTTDPLGICVMCGSEFARPLPTLALGGIVHATPTAHAQHLRSSADRWRLGRALHAHDITFDCSPAEQSKNNQNDQKFEATVRPDTSAPDSYRCPVPEKTKINQPADISEHARAAFASLFFVLCCLFCNAKGAATPAAAPSAPPAMAVACRR